MIFTKKPASLGNYRIHTRELIMRALTAEELLLVSGGTTTDSTTPDPEPDPDDGAPDTGVSF